MNNQNTVNNENIITGWQLPFSQREQGSITPENYLKSLTAAADGLYPIGVNLLWHGGIHIDERVRQQLNGHNAITCLADGEVIAYRLNSQPLIARYSSGAQARFSSSFTLVRHRLQMPGAENEAPLALTLYSLYMHLMPYASYQQHADLPRPRYWGRKPKQDCIVPLEPPRPIMMGDLIGYPGPNQRVDEPCSAPLPLPTVAMVHVELFTCDDFPRIRQQMAQRAQNLPEQQKTLAVLAKNSVLYRETPPESTLNHYSHWRSISQAKSADKWLQVSECYRFHASKTLHLGDYQANLGVYQLSERHKMNIATDFMLAPQLIPDTLIFTGDYYGEHPGQTTRDSRIARQRRYQRRGVILLPLQNENTVWVQQADLQDTTVDHIMKARRDAIPAWLHFPLQSEAAHEVGVMSAAYLLPPATGSAVPPRATDEAGTRWLFVEAANAQGQEISGWVKDEAPHITRHSPWEWPLFEALQETATPLQMLQRMQRHSQHQLQRFHFSVVMNAVHNILYPEQRDQAGAQRPTSLLLPAQLRGALNQPLQAQQLTHLVIQHESEWYSAAGLTKWDELDDLYAEESQADWQIIKTERINPMLWWNELAGCYGLSSNGQAWHFHPVGMVESFGIKRLPKVNITLSMLKKVFPAAGANKDELLELIACEINGNAEKYKLNTLRRVTHFFAQIREEAGASAKTIESFDYSVQGIIETFNYFYRNQSEAELYGRKPGQAANQIEIANRAYNGVTGNRGLGNGDYASGDGWKYRGRGFKQLTGRAHYTNFTRDYIDFWGEHIDFINNPDLLNEGIYTIRSAVYFWIKNKLYEIADEGESNEIIDKISRVVNRYSRSFNERRNHFNKIKYNGVFNEAFE